MFRTQVESQLLLAKRLHRCTHSIPRKLTGLSPLTPNICHLAVSIENNSRAVWISEYLSHKGITFLIFLLSILLSLNHPDKHSWIQTSQKGSMLSKEHTIFHISPVCLQNSCSTGVKTICISMEVLCLNH